MADRYVNYDKLLEERHRLGLDESSKIHKVNAFNQFIDHLPTSDVMEVVRCEKCRFNVANMEKDGFDITDYSGEDIVCSYFMTDGMQPTDFCSYGERGQYEKSNS